MQYIYGVTIHTSETSDSYYISNEASALQSTRCFAQELSRTNGRTYPVSSWTEDRMRIEIPSSVDGSMPAAVVEMIRHPVSG